MDRAHILVVEDDADILELVRHALTRDGYKVTGVTNGGEALPAIRKETPDIIVLDLMLPGMDGLEICRALKSETSLSNTPIIMLTAKGEESDIVAGLELGADDYITKPFSPRILLARVRACLRRAQSEPVDPGETIKHHDIEIHPGRHEARVAGERVDLTLSEFKILHTLALKPGWVFTRYQIVDAVHGEAHPVTDRSVDVQIVSLRRKLGESGDFIETVRGVGYRMRE